MLPQGSTREQFTEILRVEVATLQAQHPSLANALSRAHAILTDGRLFPEEDGRSAMVRSSDGVTWYAVNGHCPCPASQHRSEPCKHRLALRLYQRVCDRLMEDQERYDLTLDPEVVSDHDTPVAPVIRSEWLVSIQGKNFVRFEGLLELAHACGLVELSTTIVSVSDALAVCQSTARFQDGRVFCDIGDASPTNVARHLTPHFIRMAGTRASARALRRALNISHCAVEELSGEEVSS